MRYRTKDIAKKCNVSIAKNVPMEIIAGVKQGRGNIDGKDTLPLK